MHAIGKILLVFMLTTVAVLAVKAVFAISVGIGMLW